MTLPRPTILINFVGAPEQALDPRLIFIRATTGLTQDRTGKVKLAPANTIRYRYLNGVCLGALMESTRTNLLLRNQELDNASWTATNTTVTANAATSLDGTANAERLTATAASGALAQAITVVAGQPLVITCFFKQDASQHAIIRLFDGTSTIAAWFNVAAGTLGTNTATTGNLAYVFHDIEPWGSGWFRAHFSVVVSTVTSVTVSIAPTSASGAEPTNTNSVFAWMPQAEAAPRATSPIITTTATATRNADQLYTNIDSRWFNQGRGAMFWEFAQDCGGAAWPAAVFGGTGNAFGENVYLSHGVDGALRCTISNASVSQAGMFTAGGNTMADGSINKIAISWDVNNMLQVFNSSAVATDTAGTPPTNVLRIAFSGAPYSGTIGTNINKLIRVAAFWNEALPQSTLQTITKV